MLKLNKETLFLCFKNNLFFKCAANCPYSLGSCPHEQNAAVVSTGVGLREVCTFNPLCSECPHQIIPLAELASLLADLVDMGCNAA